ncbi:hypothetical protein [Hydrogenophaga sp. BPS33]|uniref:hypothetical protein n=1 Tax=Hydrogenophaga sp. BPS33 TaxID=2651974 RepID=UPI00131F534F|nr:hypothetical protein [Hydrogenophaga sp. BPS33]QHE84887.1 hypothetical protein F9K07_08305 [Hydrogenophaga sp. BPS33]
MPVTAIASALSRPYCGTQALEPDMGREATQMRKHFRMLTPEYQRLALELVKTSAKAQAKAI